MTKHVTGPDFISVITYAKNYQDTRAHIDEAMRYLETRHQTYNDDSIEDIKRKTDKYTYAGIENPGKIDLHVCPIRPGLNRTGPDPVKHAITSACEATCAHVIITHTPAVSTGEIVHAVTRGVTVHLIDAGITVHAGDATDTTRHAIDTLTGDDPSSDAILAGTPHKGGRPPLGTKVERGELRADDNYHNVCRDLQRVQSGKMSKAAAAERLDVTRKTISNALEREQLYRLD